jgi:hypothetical protein
MMDLRIVKTRRNIREAFFELRSKNALEKIRVAKLCEFALINKTTFYKHYQDIYALSEEIENETILAIMSSFSQPGALFTDPNGFIQGLYFAFKSHDKVINTLFSGRMNTLIDKVDRQLKLQYPQLSSNPERDMIVSFLVWGASHVFMESGYEESIMFATLSRVADQVMKLIGD